MGVDGRPIHAHGQQYGKGLGHSLGLPGKEGLLVSKPDLLGHCCASLRARQEKEEGGSNFAAIRTTSSQLYNTLYTVRHIVTVVHVKHWTSLDTVAPLYEQGRSEHRLIRVGTPLQHML